MMRADRLLTMAVFRPLTRWSSPRRERRLPILMYHSIADDIDARVHPYFRTVTTPASFDRQMQCLADAGFRGVTLSEGMRALNADVPAREPDPSAGAPEAVAPRPVVITFDDGFKDVYTTAAPVLQRFGFKATVFVATKFVGTRFVDGRRCLDAREIRSLAVQGIEFGSHTDSHPQLRDLSGAAVIHELEISQKRIEDILGTAVTSFSYPYRFPEEDAPFIERLRGSMNEAGYATGVTTAIGRVHGIDDPLFLKRLPVNDCDDADLLQAKLSGAYDWLHGVQLANKRLRSLLRR